MYKIVTITIISALALSSCSERGKKPEVKMEPINYPQTKKIELVDDYFGTKVADPYRWLENDTAGDTKQWVEEQNKVTFGYLEKIPYRSKIKERLTDIFNYPKYSSPFRAGEYYFFSKNDGLQNQSVIYYQKGLDGTPEIFLDPNKMSDDGTAAVSLLGFSKDKKYVAYAINQSGSDWQNIFVMEVATKKQLSDKLEWVKFSGAAWKNDGFYYSRYSAPVKGTELSQKNEYHKIYYHKLGDTQDKDVLVYEDKTKPLRYYGAQTTEDERFLLVYISEGTDGTECLYKDLNANDKNFGLVFKGFKYNYSVLNNDAERLLVHTDDNAPNYRVVSVDPKNPGKENWKDIIPEDSKNLLQMAATGGGKIFGEYLKDVATHVYQYDYTGKMEREITLPALGNASGFGGDTDDKIIFYTFTSFTYPPTIYKYDIANGSSDVWRKSDVKFNPDDYETKQVFYPSKDGTKVPMFLVYKKGIKMDGSNPTLLYGYGGFNISLEPNFSTSRLILLENGGVYALANLRGGGEYGEKWHEAGKLLKKQNVFDDFISAAEYLINEKYTSSEKLAIQGGSNGGLLVGACMTQRPDLFKVCFPAVGVMDMLRYHKFTVGWGWAVEYGSSDSLEHFNNLYKFSPLHNIKEANYPATMVTTADHDDRVVPAHSFKFISELQAKNKSANPTLIRIDVKAGHGAGKPTSKIIDEQSDIWSFMFYNMGVDVKY
ncbi:MAG TPA: prolyl oligopeptidase family serine peptidase [Bacteroidia bacterium]|nr:prolyl oligopeptidase family serine peptidase [Bacteroidia bacterium]HNU32121.1 prolyl oligopeptidase family serine peptidase [Bacteroidia bacterium]